MQIDRLRRATLDLRVPIATDARWNLRHPAGNDLLGPGGGSALIDIAVTLPVAPAARHLGLLGV